MRLFVFLLITLLTSVANARDCDYVWQYTAYSEEYCSDISCSTDYIWIGTGSSNLTFVTPDDKPEGCPRTKVKTFSSMKAMIKYLNKEQPTLHKSAKGTEPIVYRKCDVILEKSWDKQEVEIPSKVVDEGEWTWSVPSE